MSSTPSEYRRQEIDALTWEDEQREREAETERQRYAERFDVEPRDAFDDWMRDDGMSEAQVEAARADDAPSERRRTYADTISNPTRREREAFRHWARGGER